ncbi:Gfo/Idh/MocA family oxidoreductase [Anaerolentibacter hominis]|uniref:Gfo/Idh/MocA family protein n=1 Tax=Anaerolentibacter hominis TaxID=3079009 RepID=UPI0031B82006
MKLAILGAGGIARLMAYTTSRMESVECYAVAARDYGRAEAFAKEFRFEKAYGSYLEMVEDPEVELVYIATPHSHHFEHAKLCLEHGKHVLCEKAFTSNAGEAEKIFALAKEKKLLITEAIWTRYMPMRQILNDVLESGIIGKPAVLTANLGYINYNKPRLAQPELAGGALLDMGIYPLNFAIMAFGDKIKNITSSAVITEKGVDGQNSITLTYEDGRIAVLYSSCYGLSDRRGVISGDKGFIEVQNINNSEAIRVYNLDRELIQEIPAPEQISGYEYEVEACIEAIQNGDLECPQMPHAETIRMLKLMDGLRAEWGVVYPWEK